MLPIINDTPNSFTIKRFVGLGSVESELKQNPSAKIFREIEVHIGSKEVVINLSSVTKEAASGGYRNGAINSKRVIIPTAHFMVASDDEIITGELSAESYAVIAKMLLIRHELIKYRSEVDRVIAIMESV
jgi:hypothetical protein